MLTFVWNFDTAAMLCRAWWMLRRRWRGCWCPLATRFRLVVAWMLRSTAETSSKLAARAVCVVSPASPFYSFFSVDRAINCKTGFAGTKIAKLANRRATALVKSLSYQT